MTTPGHENVVAGPGLTAHDDRYFTPQSHQLLVISGKSARRRNEGGRPPQAVGSCAMRSQNNKHQSPEGIMNRVYPVILATLFCASPALAQPDATILLKADRVFDGATATPHAGWVVLVKGEK